jgi:DNA-binding HxlR family transcriptional regulator
MLNDVSQSRRRSPEPATSVITEACPVREVLNWVAGKWALAILAAVSRGPVRYLELERLVDGVSRRMLTRTLRTMERDGLLTRTQFDTRPLRVDYEATEAGRALHSALGALTQWAAEHETAIAASRAAYDATRPGADSSAIRTTPPSPPPTRSASRDRIPRPA